MSDRSIRGPTLWLLLALTTLACSSSAAGPLAEERADARIEEPLSEDADEIPCEPRVVLQSICQQCHSHPPTGGAPFPLVRRSDVVAKRELMIEQLEAGRMPLSPVVIDPPRRDALLAWLRAGAPAVSPRRCDAGVDAGSDAE